MAIFVPAMLVGGILPYCCSSSSCVSWVNYCNYCMKMYEVLSCGSWNTMNPLELFHEFFSLKIDAWETSLATPRTSLRERNDSDPSEGKVQSLRRQTTWGTSGCLMSICFVFQGWTCGYFVKVDSTKMTCFFVSTGSGYCPMTDTKQVCLAIF